VTRFHRRPTSPRLAVAALALAGLCLGAAASPAWAEDTTTGTVEAVSVRVPLYTTPSPQDFGQSGIVLIQVGRSAPMRVILDTGSVGLRLFSGALDRFRTGAVVTKTPISTPNDGGTLKGFIGKAPITIGGVTTTRSLPFQVTSNSSAWVEGWKDKGVWGILGVGMASKPLPNPLLALPANTGQRWSIHFGGQPAKGIPGGGSLVLGAQPPANAVTTIQAPPQGPDGYGSLLWNDTQANACWTIAEGRTTCIPTWFDSVADQLTLNGPAFAGLPADSDGVVKSGIPIHMSAGGSAFSVWTVVTGTTPSWNLTVATPKTAPLVNTGNRIYYDFTVTYDTTIGTISLSR